MIALICLLSKACDWICLKKSQKIRQFEIIEKSNNGKSCKGWRLISEISFSAGSVFYIKASIFRMEEKELEN